MANSDNNIETYCTNLRARARELKKMNAAIDQWLMVAVLLDNVGKKYSQFVHRIVASRDEIPDFDKVVAMLYEEDRLLKSDNTNIAMAAAMKRYKKELEDKKSSGKGNNNNTNSGRGGNNNTNNNSGGDRHSKNPNNVNYKGEGDPPECSKCTPNVNGKLKKHWPFDCWTLHEDRMPEKFRNNKPKANKVTERADDFVDSNGTHFSAMAMSAPFELGMEGDDEYWGWSVIDTAPKGCREVITEDTRTKHIDIQWHFVRDQVETGAVKFELVPTNDMVADGLTNPLTNEKFAVPLNDTLCIVIYSNPSLSEKIEHLIGRSLVSVRQHDAKLFTKAQAFRDQPEPTIAVTSPECASPGAELQIAHTPMGANRFPQLKWHVANTDRETVDDIVAEYLVVVEDPDAPLPAPVVHGIYYAVPRGRITLSPEDFEPIQDGSNMLRGGFRFGRNRMKSIWGGPKPVLGHGSHRYIFQVVGLRSTLDEGTLSRIPTKAELERAVEGKVVAWGLWVATFERKLT